jgi:phosphate transport system substrate-binding protein
MKSLLTAATAAIAIASAPVKAADITGAGATFPYPIYAKWADAYKKETGNGLNYQSIGSGGGLKAIKARTVTFAASDIPQTPKELADPKGDLVQWPMIMGGIVPVVNLDGVKANDLVLDGPMLAKIFLGDIKTWDDPAIKKLNPNIQLPSAAIAVVHRADGSGTTFNFTNYLAKVSPEWAKVGSGAAVEWPTGVGAKGNEGVAQNVQTTKNAIGYVETAYAKQNKLITTKMVNKDGKVVEANAETVQAAAANADWEKAEGFYLIITDQPGANAWPISASSFILVPKQPTGPAPSDAASVAAALKFFTWAFANGDEAAKELDYVPMPAKVKALIQSRWSEIQGPDGKPVFTAQTN